ncbi:Rhodanese-like protein [Wallemia mellicola]|nr:Rhodanese-like protein [Wallemia mellicola]
MSTIFIKPQELEHYKSTTILIDVTWHMPNANRDANEEFNQKRIPGARRLDINAISPKTSGAYQGKFPDASTFAKACSELGIKSLEDIIILYDTQGLFSVPRAAFTFLVYGFKNIKILEGGLPRYERVGLELGTSTPSAHQPSDFNRVHLDVSQVKKYEDIIGAIKDPSNQVIVDARPSQLFKDGHMPGAKSLPFNQLIESDSGSFKDHDQLRKIFEQSLGGPEQFEKVVKGDVRVINSCMAGITASIVWLALFVLGVRSSVYDASWLGYSSHPNADIVKE